VYFCENCDTIWPARRLSYARLALHRSFFNVLNVSTASLLRGKALQCKKGPAFLEKLGSHLA